MHLCCVCLSVPKLNFSAIIKSVFLVDLITPGIMYYNEMVNLVNVIANYRGGEVSNRNDSDLKYVDWDYQWGLEVVRVRVRYWLTPEQVH